MADKLAEICAARKLRLEKEKATCSFSEMDRRAREASPPRGFSEALRSAAKNGKPALICEIKKASPSAGLIRSDFDPAALARAYEAGGASCLSVLTEEDYFQGNDAYLGQARAACALPALRKDFMLDVWQIAQSRARGADAILLIMAALDDRQALDMHAAATSYGMDVLIETHDREELERACALPSGLIGINNRNLKTLRTDLSTTEDLAPFAPQDREIVSESGLHAPQDLRRMKKAGAVRFLIGESLMRETDVTRATGRLYEAFD